MNETTHVYFFCASGARYFGMGWQCSRVKSPAHASCIVVMWNRLQVCMVGRLTSQLHAAGHDNDNWTERRPVKASFLSFHRAVFRKQHFLKTKEIPYTKYNDTFNWALKETNEVRKIYQLDTNNFTMIFSHKWPLHVSDIYMSIFRSSYI